MNNYLLWSMKLSAWYGGAGSPYTSSLEQARRFPSREKAIAFCKTRFTNANSLDILPIAEADILEITKK